MDAPISFQELHALVVEDEKLNAFIVIKILNRWGITTLHAQNGLEAVALSSKERFSFILMDLQMPEMDGLLATREIRADEKNPNSETPIWAFTAYATDDARIACEKAGMNYFLTKPLDADLLKCLIHRNFLNFKAVS